MAVVANIHLIDGPEVSKLGEYRFQALPRVGETIMIGDSPADIWLRVTEVTHAPAQAIEEDWGGALILNCEHHLI